jgi:hypothetical protein
LTSTKLSFQECRALDKLSKVPGIFLIGQRKPVA